MATVRGGKQHHNQIAQTVIDWAISRLGLSDYDFDLVVIIENLDGYYGECYPARDAHQKRYYIKVTPDTTLRNFIGTILHEMVHVRQYLEGEWVSDGERECTEFEMFLTDELWKEGII
tara:strand:- start:605 stop:958 length:354 start_codon:yes stop_codon:yes gene_type:complete